MTIPQLRAFRRQRHERGSSKSYIGSSVPNCYAQAAATRAMLAAAERRRYTDWLRRVAEMQELYPRLGREMILRKVAQAETKARERKIRQLELEARKLEQEQHE